MAVAWCTGRKNEQKEWTERKQRMKVSSLIYTLSLIKSEIIKDTDPEVRFFILNEKGEKEQVFVDYISSAKEGVEILLE